MTRLLPVITAAAVTLAAPAAADLTAQGLWDHWTATAEDMGQSVTVGAQSLVGGTLSLRDVTFAMDGPEGGFTAVLPELRLSERDGGSVRIGYPRSFELRQTIATATEPTIELTLDLAMPDLSAVASGTLDNIGYDIEGPALTMTLTEVLRGGAPVDMEFVLTFGDLSGSYTMTQSQTLSFDSRLNAAAMTIALDGDDLEQGTNSGVTLNASYRDLTIENTGTGLSLMDLMDPMAIYDADSTVTSRYAHRGSTFDMTPREANSAVFTLVGTSLSGQLEANIMGGAIDYSATSNGLDLRISGPEIPFPEITAQIDTLGFGVELPIRASQEIKDIGMTLTLADLTVGESLWRMVDPSATLPRDPATLLIRLSGQARMLVDLTDPARTPSGEMPGELHALNLDEMRLSIAGAELTGSGGFTFDTSDTTTFDGLPAPNGAVEFSLAGANGLLDRLVNLGLVAQDQAMGARMFMGLFATPTGPDTMSSTVRVTPDGAISANGQRLR